MTVYPEKTKQQHNTTPKEVIFKLLRGFGLCMTLLLWKDKATTHNSQDYYYFQKPVSCFRRKTTPQLVHYTLSRCSNQLSHIHCIYQGSSGHMQCTSRVVMRYAGSIISSTYMYNYTVVTMG